MKPYEQYKDSGVEWIGEIPVGWDCDRLKYISIVTNSGIWGEDEPFEGSIPLPIPTTGQLTIQGEWIYEKMEIRYVTTTELDEYLCHEGDTIVVKSSGSSTNIITGKCGYVNSDDSTSFGFGNFLLRIRPTKLNPRLVYYFLGSNITKQRIERMVSSTTYPNLKVNEYSNSVITVPPLPEQHQIVTYLDQKTSQIEELIDKKTRKIELLKEYRTSLINQVVTKGLDPNVEMKDSGVEWIGEIPVGWDYVKIGHYTTLVRGGSPRPSGDKRFFNGDYIPWITVKDITNPQGKYVVSTDSFLTEEGMKRSRVLETETLVLSNSGVTLGVPKILKIKGCINDGSVGLQKIKDTVYRDYLYYFFMTQTKLLREQQSGYGQPNLNTDIISNIRFPLPPLPEQQQIVTYLDQKTQEIDQSIQTEEKKIDHLKEYRQSLISNVVTGKIDVRETVLS